MAPRKAARLYFGLNNTNPVNQHLTTLIPVSPIGMLTMMCNNIDCVARKIHVHIGQVEPDPKGNTRLRQRRTTVLLAAKVVKQ